MHFVHFDPTSGWFLVLCAQENEKSPDGSLEADKKTCFFASVPCYILLNRYLLLQLKIIPIHAPPSPELICQHNSSL